MCTWCYNGHTGETRGEAERLDTRQTNGQTNGQREGGKRGRFAYAYKICRGRAISRPIAWKTHAKISIPGHLACNLIKQDQRLDLTIGITGRVAQRGGVPSANTLGVRVRVRTLTQHPGPSATWRMCTPAVSRMQKRIGTMILMFARHFTLLSFLPSNQFESRRVVGHD